MDWKVWWPQFLQRTGGSLDDLGHIIAKAPAASLRDEAWGELMRWMDEAKSFRETPLGRVDTSPHRDGRFHTVLGLIIVGANDDEVALMAAKKLATLGPTQLDRKFVEEHILETRKKSIMDILNASNT